LALGHPAVFISGLRERLLPGGATADNILAVVLRVSVQLVVLAMLLLVPFRGGSSGRTSPTRRPAPRPPATALEEPGDSATRATSAAQEPAYPLFLHPLPGEAPGRRVAAPAVRDLVLTFDDGPDLLATPVILEELDRRGLKAIFFVNGRHLVGNRPQDLARRDLVRKMAAHGHLIANHTLSHRNVCAEPELLEREIDGNAEIITAATGVRPLLFRAPYGARCRRLDQALRDRDLVQVGWNLDPQEWKGGGEDGVYAYVTKRLARFAGRATLILHDTHSQAVRALPRILDWIARENHRVARDGGMPIRLRDYGVFIPSRPLGETGFEPLLADLRDAFSVLPGLAGERDAVVSGTPANVR
jgi:peptidoglycan/xylan/chitin deacetylase (PgdA/CDA1 family)